MIFDTHAHYDDNDFAADREAGERFVYDFLRHFIRHAAERYKAITAQAPTAEGKQ